MRKKIYIICLLLTCLVSCKKEPARQDLGPQLVEFSPALKTKAYMESVTDPLFCQGFSVYADKLSDDNKTKEIFVNYKVHSNDGGKTWIYNDIPGQPDVYWGLNCYHEFLAVYPYNAEATKFDATTENYLYGPVNTFNEADGSPIGPDILYGRHQQTYKMGIPPTPVALKMEHALAAISVNVRNVSDNDVLEISGMSLEGLYTRATDLTIPRTPGGNVTMNIDETSDKTTDTPAAPLIYKFPTFNNVDNASLEYRKAIDPFIIIPQVFVKKSVILKLSIVFPEFVPGSDPQSNNIEIDLSNYPVQNEMVEDQYSYLSGHHYQYNLDITNTTVTVHVTVVPWIDDPIIDLI